MVARSSSRSSASAAPKCSPNIRFERAVAHHLLQHVLDTLRQARRGSRDVEILGADGGSPASARSAIPASARRRPRSRARSRSRRAETCRRPRPAWRAAVRSSARSAGLCGLITSRLDTGAAFRDAPLHRLIEQLQPMREADGEARIFFSGFTKVGLLLCGHGRAGAGNGQPMAKTARTHRKQSQLISLHPARSARGALQSTSSRCIIGRSSGPRSSRAACNAPSAG